MERKTSLSTNQAEEKNTLSISELMKEMENDFTARDAKLIDLAKQGKDSLFFTVRYLGFLGAKVQVTKISIDNHDPKQINTTMGAEKLLMRIDRNDMPQHTSDELPKGQWIISYDEYVGYLLENKRRIPKIFKSPQKEKSCERKKTSLRYMLYDLLPTEECDDDGKDYLVWTNGSMFFCPSEDAANFLADLIELADNTDVCTGYYDPKEDEESGTVDRYTGWWYVD